MKNRKGFTLVELIIVIVIVGILSIVAVPVYKGYTKKAMGTEAKTLLGSIATAEKVYFAEYSHFRAVEETGFDKELDVDARSNKYFTAYTVDVQDGTEDETAFYATVNGLEGSGADNISMVMIGKVSDRPELHEAYDPGETLPSKGE